jgi:hypothetical protein
MLAYFLAAVCGLTASAAARATDPSGTWKWERTLGDRTMSSVLKLDVEDGKLVGSYAGRGDAVEIEDGKIEGDELSFKVTRSRNDRTFTVTFRGKVNEDAIAGTGTFQFGDQSRDFDWQAQRSVEPADVVGTWQFTVTTPDGQTFEPSLKLSRQDEALKGAYTSRFGEFQAQEIQIKDNHLTFFITGENDGNVWKVSYNGKPRGSSIAGSVEFDFGGQSGTLEFTGKRQKSAAAVDDDDDDGDLDDDDDGDDDDDDDDDDNDE